MKTLALFGIIAIIFATACSGPEAAETQVPPPDVQTVTEPAPEEIEQELDTSELEQIEEELDIAILE